MGKTKKVVGGNQKLQKKIKGKVISLGTWPEADPAADDAWAEFSAGVMAIKERTGPETWASLTGEGLFELQAFQTLLKSIQAKVRLAPPTSSAPSAPPPTKRKQREKRRARR